MILVHVSSLLTNNHTEHVSTERLIPLLKSRKEKNTVSVKSLLAAAFRGQMH